MKTQIKLMVTALVALAVTAVSCKKDTDNNPTPNKPAPATKPQMLTAKSWKMTSSVTNGVEWLWILPGCEKDNTVLFKTNGVATMDEGPTKCKATDPQTDNGTWKFLNNETKLVMDEDTSDIIKITPDSLVLKSVFIDDGDMDVTFSTFVTVK
ncbi:MAG TPA: lipocalin family protein [Bacteroidia bacterium]|nr:lipocalin family protein [Bacteroidia bacterium]